ncbi:MAG: hypothetical protein ACRDPY_15180 [Streptosporangiaceae bacterium]
MRYQLRPLNWTALVTPGRQSSAIFRASWSDTLALLGDEIEQLGGGRSDILFEVDVQEADLRLDGMLRANAKMGDFPGVVVTFDSKFGQLRYASDAYEQRYKSAPPGWQANIRAVALALQALRAVDRYGVSKRGEQYTGWRAIAGPAPEFATADDAVKWMYAYAIGQLDLTLPDAIGNRDLYRLMAKLMHPDRGAPRAEWDRLDTARQVLETAGRL